MRRARLLLVAIGTRGDVEPFARLGTALTARGHRVTAAVLADGADRIREAGVTPAVVGPPSPQTMWSTSALVRTVAHVNPGLMYLQMRASLAAAAPGLASALVPLLDDSDAVLSGLASAAIVPVTRAAGLPSRLVLSAPVLPGPGSTWSTRWADRLPHPLESRRQHLMWDLTHGLSTALAGEVAGRRTAARGRRRPPHRRGPAPAAPPLLATSPVLDPAPGPHVHPTGWWRDPRPVGPLPDDLDDHLQCNPGAVLISLGSLPGRDADARAAGLAAVTTRAGRTAVVQVAGATPGPVPGGYVVGDVDHRALLPRLAAVVHHGGSGTTHAATAAGLPQVVMPHLGDQAHYGRRVHRSGLGPAPLPRALATPAALAARLQTALADPRYAHHARAAAHRLLAEDGLATTVRLVEEMVA